MGLVGFIGFVGFVGFRGVASSAIAASAVTSASCWTFLPATDHSCRQGHVASLTLTPSCFGQIHGFAEPAHSVSQHSFNMG